VLSLELFEAAGHGVSWAFSDGLLNREVLDLLTNSVELLLFLNADSLGLVVLFLDG